MIKPLLVNPPMCTLKELEDGTYTLYDLEVMHQIMEIKAHVNKPVEKSNNPYQQN